MEANTIKLRVRDLEKTIGKYAQEYRDTKEVTFGRDLITVEFLDGAHLIIPYNVFLSLESGKDVIVK